MRLEYRKKIVDVCLMKVIATDFLSRMRRPMKSRPTSITIIGYYLIVSGALVPISILYVLVDARAVEYMKMVRMPMSIQYINMFLKVLITLGCGIGLLKGKNIARFVFLAWNVIGFLVALFTIPAKMLLVPGMVFFLVLMIFLFSPKANRYFAFNESPDDTPHN